VKWCKIEKDKDTFDLFKIIEKKVLTVVLSLSIVSSILVSIIRWRVEADNHWVEMAWGFCRTLPVAGVSIIILD